MISTIVQILDHLVTLLKERQADRRALFLDFIEPLFIELQPVVDDYFALFRRAEEAVDERPQAEASMAFTEIRARRDAMLRARVQVRTLADEALGSIGELRVAAFLERVVAFFYGLGRVPGASRSRGDRLVALWEYAGDEGLRKADLLTGIRQTLRALEEDWVAVAQAYASLRIHCLAPPRYIRRKPNDEGPPKSRLAGPIG